MAEKRMTEKSRVLARYGPSEYKKMFGTKKAPSKKQHSKAKSKWIGGSWFIIATKRETKKSFSIDYPKKRTRMSSSRKTQRRLR